jgi:hypothetical protein
VKLHVEEENKINVYTQQFENQTHNNLDMFKSTSSSWYKFDGDSVWDTLIAAQKAQADLVEDVKIRSQCNHSFKVNQNDLH